MQQIGYSVAATFSANGIGREGGDGSAQRGRSIIYNCLVHPVELTVCGIVVDSPCMYSGLWADAAF